jgi:hypothetical protein
MTLEQLLVTLRQHGVCRWKGPVEFGKGVRVEVELELWQHAPRPPAEAMTPKLEGSKSRLGALPEDLRKSLSADQQDHVEALAARLFPVRD